MPSYKSSPKVHVKSVASVASQIVSLYSLFSCMRPLACIMTRFLFSVVYSAVSVAMFLLSVDSLHEILNVGLAKLDYYRSNWHD